MSFHAFSCQVIIPHILSCISLNSFMSSHILSCFPFKFFHVISNTFIFFQILSCHFSAFHVISVHFTFMSFQYISCLGIPPGVCEFLMRNSRAVSAGQKWCGPNSSNKSEVFVPRLSLTPRLSLKRETIGV